MDAKKQTRYLITFIEEPDVFTANDMQMVLGGRDKLSKCGCHCLINVNTKHNMYGKPFRRKLYEHNAKGSYCFVVTVQK